MANCFTRRSHLPRSYVNYCHRPFDKTHPLMSFHLPDLEKERGQKLDLSDAFVQLDVMDKYAAKNYKPPKKRIILPKCIPDFPFILTTTKRFDFQWPKFTKDMPDDVIHLMDAYSQKHEAECGIIPSLYPRPYTPVPGLRKRWLEVANDNPDTQ